MGDRVGAADGGALSLEPLELKGVGIVLRRLTGPYTSSADAAKAGVSPPVMNNAVTKTAIALEIIVRRLDIFLYA
jgi:hypothetical protein